MQNVALYFGIWNSRDFDQTAQLCRLVQAFAVSICITHLLYVEVKNQELS